MEAGSRTAIGAHRCGNGPQQQYFVELRIGPWTRRKLADPGGKAVECRNDIALAPRRTTTEQD